MSSSPIVKIKDFSTEKIKEFLLQELEKYIKDNTNEVSENLSALKEINKLNKEKDILIRQINYLKEQNEKLQKNEENNQEKIRILKEKVNFNKSGIIVEKPIDTEQTEILNEVESEPIVLEVEEIKPDQIINETNYTEEVIEENRKYLIVQLKTEQIVIISKSNSKQYNLTKNYVYEYITPKKTNTIEIINYSNLFGKHIGYWKDNKFIPIQQTEPKRDTTKPQVNTDEWWNLPSTSYISVNSKKPINTLHTSRPQDWN